MAANALIGFGTATFLPQYGLGGETPSADALSLLIRQAVENGVRYIDTAAGYGESEGVLGRLRSLLASRHVRVCTKLTAASLANGVQPSLERLRCDRLDSLLAHSATRKELTDPLVVRALSAAKHAGLVDRIGASTYGVSDARWALEQPWCDVVQVEHSILNPSVVQALTPIKRPGQELTVRSVLCKGLLSDRRADAGNLIGTGVAVLARLEALAQEWGYRLPELAIRFALDTPAVDIVLVGISARSELETALAAAQRPPLEFWQMEQLAEFNCSAQDWAHPERWKVSA